MISIHVPREGHDRAVRRHKVDAAQFQSTCPARGTTSPCVVAASAGIISIHVPREGHDLLHKLHRVSAAPISIHVPREGHDP